MVATVSGTLDRQGLLAWYDRNRARAAQLFGLVADEVYYTRPIALRNPIVFYEGHLPAFSFLTLVRRGLGRPSIDERLEGLFARGIDPHEAACDPRARGNEADLWPSRAQVREFVAEADRQVREALREGAIEQPGHPLLDRGEAAWCILEHEATHLETLLYMWHRLPLKHKHRPADYRPKVEGAAPPVEWIDVPAGPAVLGVERNSVPFAWDNEMPAYAQDMPGFQILRHNVTNAEYREFVEAGGYRQEKWWRPEDWRWLRSEGLEHPTFWERAGQGWLWRGLFDHIALPEAWPVWVSQAEASAYARWRGWRLPTEAEYQRAGYGSPDGGVRRFPWGDETPRAIHGVFDFSSWDPEPVGTHPAGQSAWGIHDLVGNGWEWTATPFAPFPGFAVRGCYPEYSEEFFDGEHFVLKGASPATVAELVRPSFRNWFRGRYPFVYGSFRCVREARA
jgi:ergothioneine biosynthesis protein EgtB